MKNIKQYILKPYIFILGIAIMLGFICNFTFSKYHKAIYGAGGANIAKPVINIEKDEVKEFEMYKGGKEIEYDFSVSNFKNNILSEVDFEYIISIEETAENFPVQYSLLNDKNEEIKLDNNKTEKILLSKENETVHSYKLIAKWQDLEGELSEKDNVRINVEIIQLKNREGENSF
jgi:hypothetical protein